MKNFKAVKKEDVQRIKPGELVFISDLGGICEIYDFYVNNSNLFRKRRVPALTIPAVSDYYTDKVFAALYVDDRNVPYFFSVRKYHMDKYGVAWVLEVAE